MSRAGGCDSGRFSALAETLENTVAEVGQRPLARLLGMAPSTVRDWQHDPEAWNVRALVNLCWTRADVCDALVACLPCAPALPQGDARQAGASAHQMLARCGQTVTELAADLADGRIDRHEAARVIAALRELMRSAETLMADATDAMRPGFG